MRRYRQFDTIRGIAILYVVFAHTSIYNYEGIRTLGQSTLPLHLIVMGVIALWGGVFALTSLIVNTAATASRLKASTGAKPIVYTGVAGLLYLTAISTLHILFFGRWDIYTSKLDSLPMVAQLIRGEEITLHLERLLSLGSGITMIGFNLIVLSAVLLWLYRKNKLSDVADNYIFLGGIGCSLLILASLRIALYPTWAEAQQDTDWIITLMLNPFVSGPYPIISYLAYGFIGAMLGLMLHHKRLAYLVQIITPVSGVLLLISLSIAVTLQPNLLGVSWFWYAKFLAETAFFVLAFSLIITRILRTNNTQKHSSNILSTALFAASRISLTIYLLETLTSELLRSIWLTINPAWSHSLAASIGLGAINMALWAAIAILWSKINYRYSFEYFWTILFAKLGKESSKLHPR